MKSKIYKRFLLLLMVLAPAIPAIAQSLSVQPMPPPAPAPVAVYEDNFSMDNLNITLNKINSDVSVLVNKSLAKLDKQLKKNINRVTPEIADVINSINLNVDINQPCNNRTDTEIQDEDLEELTKNYSKTYTAGANDMLDIDNRYGKVTVNTWNKNEFKVDVQIKVATKRGGDAKKMLENVIITDGRQGSTVWFKTRFSDDDDRGSWSFFTSGKHRSVKIIEINYNIYMPVKSDLKVTNKYGSTVLPDLYGKLNIYNAYGNLTAKNLTNVNNNINIKYGSADIIGLNGCDLNVAYGNLKLAECEKLNANVSYGSAKIGSLKTSANINVKYGGGLVINVLENNLQKLVVNSSYSGVRLGLPQVVNLDFDVTVHYGSFNYNDNAVKVINTNINEKGFNPTKVFKGTLGKGSNDNIIVIKSNYGSVKFE